MNRVLLLVAGGLLHCVALAQFPFTRTLEVRSGQQRPAITSILQDDDGLLWAASDLGLLRTDGELVEPILRTEGNPVLAMALAGDGVWAALATGHIVRCGPLACDTIIPSTLADETGIRALLVDADGAVWIATYGAGLIRWSNGEVRRFTVENGLPDDHVNDLARLPDGTVVAATDQGLAVCDQHKVASIFGEEEGAPDNLVLSVCTTRKGMVIAGTHRGGVFRWEPGTGRMDTLLPPDRVPGPIEHVAVRNDLVWCATPTLGVILFDRAPTGGLYLPPVSLPNAPAIAKDLLLDAEGAVWWCDGTEYLHRADPAILVVPEHEGVDLRRISAVCTGPDHHIWFNTPQGLFKHPAAFTDGSRITKVELAVPSRTPVVSLATTPDGTIWAGTFGDGVHAVARDGTKRHFTERNGTGSDHVLAVRSLDEQVWCATLKGVARYQPSPQEWRSYIVPGPGFVYDVLPLADGRVYAATDGNGVLALDLKDTATALGLGTYYSLVGLPSGAVWAAGPGTGLCRVTRDLACLGANGPSFTGEFFAMGTIMGRILAFGSDATVAFDPLTGAWTDLTARFGLGGLRAELNALCTGPDSTLWLACDRGLVRIRPEAKHFDPFIRTAVTRVEVDDRPVLHAGVIEVPSDGDRVMFQFAGSHFADPGAVRFAYRLVGHEDREKHTRDRSVSYEDLPAGRYTFRVRAYVSEVPDADHGWIEVRFAVQAVWWKRPWVVLSMVVALGLVVFLLLRARERRSIQRERSEQDKVRFQLEALRSQVDPHFLFNSFNALVALIETDRDKAIEHVDQLSTFFRNILMVRDKDLVSVEEELGLLRTYFDLEQRRFGDAIGLDIQVPEEAHERCIVPLTLQLLVENALKHNVVTATHPLRVTIVVEGEDIVVRNQVSPKLTPARSTGFGLQSIRKRYTALTARPIAVGERNGLFEVRIPLIHRRA